MRVGIPSEIKNNEFRVAITPAGVAEFTRRGHHVVVQAGAGEGSSIPDADFKVAGAEIITGAEHVWDQAELLLKVKEPIEAEYSLLRPDQTLFAYLHLAASRSCADALLHAGSTAIAYETVQTPDGTLPLLAPMSEVAGRLAAQVGAYHLMRPAGGRGVLMGGVPGVGPADVVVIGGGTAGYNAARVAAGMGAHVTVFDLNIVKLRELDAEFGGRIRTRYSSTLELEGAVKRADLVIGAVLVPGARAPKLVSNSLVAQMNRAPSSSTSRSIRAAASRTRGPPPTTSQPSRSTRRSSTAWRTCPARCHGRRRSRSPTPRCHTCCTGRYRVARCVPFRYSSGQRAVDPQRRAAQQTRRHDLGMPFTEPAAVLAYRPALAAGLTSTPSRTSMYSGGHRSASRRRTRATGTGTRRTSSMHFPGRPGCVRPFGVAWNRGSSRVGCGLLRLQTREKNIIELRQPQRTLPRPAACTPPAPNRRSPHPDDSFRCTGLARRDQHADHLRGEFAVASARPSAVDRCL